MKQPWIDIKRGAVSTDEPIRDLLQYTFSGAYVGHLLLAMMKRGSNNNEEK